MRKVIVALVTAVIILSCSPQAGLPEETPTEHIPPISLPDPTGSPTGTQSSATEAAISTAMPSIVTSLPTGVYPVTYSEEGFHIRSVLGEEFAFIPSPFFGPGEASPDGQYLVVTQPDVTIIDLHTGEFETYSEFLPGFFPSWSPDSRRLAYTSVEDDHDFMSLFVLDLEKMNTQRLTFKKGFELAPSWSPDGISLAYASDTDNGPLGSTWLFILDVACIESESCDDDSRRLEALPEHQSAGFPSWSPSGDRLAYLCTDDQGTSICLYDFSSSMSSELITDVSQFSQVKWSPDGHWIGFTRQSALSDMNRGIIYDLISGEERILSPSDREEFFSTWITLQ